MQKNNNNSSNNSNDNTYESNLEKLIKFNQSINELSLDLQSLRDISINEFNEGGKFYINQNDLPIIAISPFFSIKMHPMQYYWVNSIFSELIYGENATNIEIVYNNSSSADNDSKSIISIKLFKTDSKGNLLQIIDNPLPDLKISPKELNDAESLYTKLKDAILEKYKFELGSVIIKNSKIKINNLIENFVEDEAGKEINYKNILNYYAEIIVDVFQSNLINIFPKPPVYKFLEQIIARYPDLIFFLKNAKFLHQLIPKINTSITLFGDSWYATFLIIFNLDKKSKKNILDTIKIIVCPILEFGHVDHNDPYFWTNLLQKISNKYKETYNIKLNLIFDASSVKKFIFGLLESSIPFTEQRLYYLLEELMFGIKNIEDFWDISPKPIFYNDNI
ncbi:MAG: hypothetical protein ACTSRZ_10355, partial [Promethearchaeota archaeon]